MEKVIQNHPLMIKRWAKLYVDRYAKNPQEAIKWGTEFFPDDAVPLVVEEAKKEIRKRGLRFPTK